MLGRVVAADGAIDESTGESTRVGDVEEVCDVQGRGGLTVEDADRPALFGEAPVPGADVASCVGMHVCVAGVPEEPDVLLIGEGLGMKEMVIDFSIRTQVKEVSGDSVEACGEWVGLFVHCES